MSKESAAKKEKGGKVIITGCVVVIAVLAIVVIVLLTERSKEGAGEEDKRNVVVNQQNAEEVAEQLVSEQYVAPGYYSTQMTTAWHFQTGDAVSADAYVANDERNTNDVYFDVFLAEDESTPILKSPVMPRGAELNNIALDTPLEAGNYDCIMIYHLVDEDQNDVSTLRVGLTIFVEQ